MSFAQPWWLLGLLLLVPLVLLHLRRPRAQAHEVPTLLLWDDLGAPAAAAENRLRRPQRPLLLALQALAVAAAVVALAGPQHPGAVPSPSLVVVVDSSMWMRVAGRPATAARVVGSLAARHPGDRLAVVRAGPQPAVVYRGTDARAAAAAAARSPSPGQSDLRAALTTGVGLLGDRSGRMVLVRAPEDPAPAVDGGSARLSQVVVGTPAADQGLLGASARCGIGPAGRCLLFATVDNESGQAVSDPYTALVAGRAVLRRRVAVPAHARAILSLTASPGTRVELRLDVHDVLAADDRAFVDVPGAANAPPSSTLTLVGDPATALPLARAFAAVPGVTLRLRTTRTYSAADARASVLVVVDGVLPAAGLPDSPAVLLVRPGLLPGGRAGGALPAAPLTGAEDDDPLLAGVDLSSLALEPGAARAYALPPWMRPLAWSGANPLLAAGGDGRRRIALLAFDPARSDLPQLDALPILARNVVQWASGWAPGAAAAGAPLAVDVTPGATATRIGGSAAEPGAPAAFRGLAAQAATVRQTGPGIARTHRLAVCVPLPTSGAATPVDLGGWAGVAPVRPQDPLWRWAVLVALLAVAAEWAVWRWSSR